MADRYGGQFFIPSDYWAEANQIFEGNELNIEHINVHQSSKTSEEKKRIFEVRFEEERNGAEEISDELRTYENEAGEACPIPHIWECDSYYEYQAEEMVFSGSDSSRESHLEDGGYFITVSQEGEISQKELDELRRHILLRKAWFEQFAGCEESALQEVSEEVS